MPIIRYDLYMRSWDSNSDDDWFLHSSYPEDARGLAEASKDCYENHQKQWPKSCWDEYKVEEVTKEVNEVDARIQEEDKETNAPAGKSKGAKAGVIHLVTPLTYKET